MKIDSPESIDKSNTTVLEEYNIDRENIGLGQTYGILAYGLSVAVGTILFSGPVNRQALNRTHGCRACSQNSMILQEYNIDRENIGLGQTYGILAYGLSACSPSVNMIPENGSNKLPRAAQMISAMLF